MMPKSMTDFLNERTGGNFVSSDDRQHFGGVGAQMGGGTTPRFGGKATKTAVPPALNARPSMG